MKKGDFAWLFLKIRPFSSSKTRSWNIVDNQTKGVFYINRTALFLHSQTKNHSRIYHVKDNGPKWYNIF